jgi:hypothetical protein
MWHAPAKPLYCPMCTSTSAVSVDMVRTELGSACYIGPSVFREFPRKSWQKIIIPFYFSCFVDLEIGKHTSCMNPEQITWTRTVSHDHDMASGAALLGQNHKFCDKT